MRGRKPKPTAKKVLQGTFRKDRAPKNEPKPDSTLPACPSHLYGPARAAWRRLVPELHALGIVTTIDRDMIAAYCSAYGQWVTAEKKIKDAGLIHVTTTGRVIKSPMLQVSQEAVETMRKIGPEFGLTPSSRARLSVTKTTEDDAKAMEREYFG